MVERLTNLAEEYISNQWRGHDHAVASFAGRSNSRIPATLDYSPVITASGRPKALSGFGRGLDLTAIENSVTFVFIIAFRRKPAR